jgi:hypothetical protein
MKRFLVAFAASAIMAACDDDPESHVYVAAQYDPVDVCFGPSTSLGVIDTSTGDLDCAPTCLVLSAGGGAGTVKTYVSTMCGPYPAQYDTSQTDPSCPPALAAWPAEQTALANGTNSCASPASDDAGPDATAGGGTDGGGSDDGGAVDASDTGVPMDAPPG